MSIVRFWCLVVWVFRLASGNPGKGDETGMGATGPPDSTGSVLHPHAGSTWDVAAFASKEANPVLREVWRGSALFPGGRWAGTLGLMSRLLMLRLAVMVMSEGIQSTSQIGVGWASYVNQVHTVTRTEARLYSYRSAAPSPAGQSEGPILSHTS